MEHLDNEFKNSDNRIYFKDELPPEDVFLKRFRISVAEFKKTGLKWADLRSIHSDYLVYKLDLETAAESIVKTLLTKEAKNAGVHSVRYRIKDAESLIAKIIRKKSSEKERLFTKDTYRSEITDLIGIRALHVFKNDWLNIDEFIRSKWKLKRGNPPIMYHRKGDSPDFIKLCKDNGCKVDEHPKEYRSIHYIILTSPGVKSINAEIQVRTIFEEGWSEIDHKLRYSEKKGTSNPLDHYLSILNRIAGSADEIGSLIKKRDSELQKLKNEQNDSTTI